MKYIFHPEAEKEFLHSIDYYEECEPGLGLDFSFEVYSTIQRIINFPNAWPILVDDIRRCLTNRFPYGVIFSNEPDYIFILAVMHLYRNPDYWKSRL